MKVVFSTKVKKKSNNSETNAYDFLSLGADTTDFDINCLETLNSFKTNGDNALLQEKRKLIVECLMISGENRPTVIARKLEINRATARKYIKQVEYRWSIARSKDVREIRAISLARLEHIHRSLWALVDSKELSDRDKLRALSRLRLVNDQIQLAQGLTPNSIGQLVDGGR